MIKRRFGVFVAYQFRTTFDAFLEKVFASGNKEACEIALQKEGPESLWARIEAATDASRGQGEACRAVMRDISEREQAEEQLRYVGSHDALTGLYNRGFFMEEMARLERGRQFPVSIIMADLDHLKDTNDHHGHAAGDALLKRVAQALTAAFRAEDVVARIGGDEFAVLLPATGWLDAEILLKRVYLEIQKDNAAHTETPIRLSIGFSTARSNAPLLGTLKEADENMYRKKREQNAS